MLSTMMSHYFSLWLINCSFTSSDIFSVVVVVLLVSFSLAFTNGENKKSPLFFFSCFSFCWFMGANMIMDGKDSVALGFFLTLDQNG